MPDAHQIIPKVYKAFHQAILSDLIRTAHDLSEGRLTVAAAEMRIGRRLGMKIESNMWDDAFRVLSGESTGTLLVEVRKHDKERFLSMFNDLPLESIGTVTQENKLNVFIHGFNVLNVFISDLIAAWNTPL